VRGVVRLTAPPWLAARVIIPALPGLKKRYPELDVQLLGTNAILNLPQREADLAIRNLRPSQPSLSTRKVGRLGGCVYGSRIYVERRGAPSSRAELRGHDVLTYEGLGGMPGFEWIREPATGGNIVFSANDPEALVSAATAGLGLAAVPCMLGDTQPSLVRIEGLGVSFCDMFVVAQAPQRSVRRIRAVSDFIAGVFQANRTVIEGVN
jgi:DNA-binding transcriptional LysR family regulator